MAFSTSNVATGEVNAGVTITVILSIPTTQNVTVNYATFDGTATAGSDYMAVSGILTFTPGQVSQSFIVPILDDSINEVAETVGLQLTAPVNGTLGTPNPATLTISDNDPVTVQFSSGTYSVIEDAVPAPIAVTLSTTSAQTIAVDYATSELLATAGLDYTDVNNVLTFAPGQTSLNFSVPILEDDLEEPDETVQLTLSNPTNGATLGTPNPAILTIEDDGDVMGCPGTMPAGEPDIIPPALTPNGIFVNVGCGTAIIVDLGSTVIDTTTPDSAYDLVYYERGQPTPPMTSTFIFMDWIVVQIGPTASGPWYSVFYWGDYIADTNSNANTDDPNFIALGLIEDNNVTISTTFLYSSTNPLYPTGIAIDVDNPNPLLQSPPPPPGIYQFVRLYNPPNAILNDSPEIDAIEVLP